MADQDDSGNQNASTGIHIQDDGNEEIQPNDGTGGTKIEGNVENEETNDFGSEETTPPNTQPAAPSTTSSSIPSITSQGASEGTSEGENSNGNIGQPEAENNTVSQSAAPMPTPPLPEQPQISPPPANQTVPSSAQQQQPKKKSKLPFIAIALILVVIVLAVGGSALLKPQKSIQNTTTPTTLNYAQTYKISSCSALNKPGKYYLTSNVVYTSLAGSCMSIQSSNVMLECSNNSIIGSGPYVVGSSYSTGISVQNSTNVSINECHITKFSYGIISKKSSDVKASHDNVSYNVQSNLYLNSTKSSSFINDKFEGIKTNYSSVYLVNGSIGDLIQNDNISDNINGLYINGSTNDSYINNTILKTNTSLKCNLDSGVYGTSTATSNSCVNNYGCSFLSCSSLNVPANISNISLGSRISTCGAIVSPGNYFMSSGINAYYVEPFGAKWSYNIPCITIDAPKVNLFCNNNQIYNATIGISIENSYYDNLSRCNVRNASVAGIQIINSTGVSINGTNISGSPKGLYLVGSDTNQFSRFYIHNNGFGIYLNNSQTETFESGKVLNNSNVDIFANSNSVRDLSNFATNLTCGISDTEWARCSNYINPQLNEFYLNACGPLRFSGNYTLQSNIFSTSSDCFSIDNAKNVTLNCNGHILTNRVLNGPSSAVEITDAKNITVENCATNNFGTSINVSNSLDVSIINNQATGIYQSGGIYLSRSLFSGVVNNRLSNESDFGIYLNDSYYSNVSNNIIKYVKGTGILVNNSQNDSVTDNTGFENHAGMYIEGSSQNNLVGYNNISLSASYDYGCSTSDSGINAELGGINYGSKKSGCLWLAAIIKGQPLSCTSALGPSTYSLQSDYVYPTGTTCFAVYANDTTINCNNHTVIATNGGTFASFLNSHNDGIYNCNLKGFSPAISISKSKVAVLNDVIGSNSTSNDSYAITASASSGLQIRNVSVSSRSGGIYLSNDANGTISNSTVNATAISYYLSNSNFMNVIDSYSAASSGTGWFLTNSTQDNILNSRLYGTVSGLQCSGSSAKTGADVGTGNNYGTVLSCPWATG